MQNRFFAMMARMKLIRRWGLMFSTRDENLSEHSLDTAFFMHALLALHNRRFLAPGEEPLDLGTGVLLAIYHDAAEILTGDLPTPVKYFSSEISEAYKTVEVARPARACWTCCLPISGRTTPPTCCPPITTPGICPTSRRRTGSLRW